MVHGFDITTNDETMEICSTLSFIDIGYIVLCVFVCIVLWILDSCICKEEGETNTDLGRTHRKDPDNPT